MSAIEIEDQIKSLAPDELQKLTDWFVQFALRRQEEARENRDLTDVALKKFAMSYGDDEPEYSIADIKK
jgi:hypothetical protein